MVDGKQTTQYEIVKSLGIQGWGHLDPIILAALATEAPLLLVGPHGTAKSLLVERIAAAMHVSMRHYNASLMNYDDLVGIPLPDEKGESLHFVHTPGSIWDAEFVFFDEISRCRSDLQNKLFPIIHERRVSGIQLEKLKYRWAAMNPPSPDDTDTGNTSVVKYYFGSEPLDPALADRFPFVIFVPNWINLNKDDRRSLIAWKDPNNPFDNGSANGILKDHPLRQLVEQCAALIPKLEEDLSSWISDYIIYVVDLLEQAKLPQSPRRARMLARAVVAVHAARTVLEGDDVDLEYSAEIALTYCLPENASEVQPSLATVVAAHKQAWEISMLEEDDELRQVFGEPDLVQRIILADQLNIDDGKISRLITQALGAETSDARRIGLATAVFLAFHERRNLTSAAWEPLAQFAARVLEPRVMLGNIQAGPSQETWQDINNWIASLDDKPNTRARLERNYILNGFPDFWMNENWEDALKYFRSTLNYFGIKEVAQ
jgi:MoxR-like ATPase